MATSRSALRDRMARRGLPVAIGPFTVWIQSPLAAVASGLELFYLDQIVGHDEGFFDFHVRLAPPNLLRRWSRGQVIFYVDGQTPFRPLPINQAFAFFEWGLNWCIAQYAHQYLQIHSAVLERDGRAIIIPGSPGSGKSTLCAALATRGWRLLSDEFALISLRDGRLAPLPRPISLKNESIEIIRRFAPEATIGPPAADTNKGTVAHMRAPQDSVARAKESALPAWVVFPQFSPGAGMQMEPLPKARSLLRIAGDSFNYSVLGLDGFEATADLIHRCDCYTMTYSDLDAAIATLDALPVPAHRASSQPPHRDATKT